MRSSEILSILMLKYSLGYLFRKELISIQLDVGAHFPKGNRGGLPTEFELFLLCEPICGSCASSRDWALAEAAGKLL